MNNGDFYEGQWEYDKLHGFAKFEKINGEKFFKI